MPSSVATTARTVGTGRDELLGQLDDVRVIGADDRQARRRTRAQGQEFSGRMRRISRSMSSSVIGRRKKTSYALNTSPTPQPSSTHAGQK